MSAQQEIEALEAAWLESTGKPLTSIVATTNGKLDCDYIDLSILMDVFHGGVLYGIVEQRQRADMAEDRLQRAFDEIGAMAASLTLAEEREKKLREVLEFYADDGNYMSSGYLGSSEVDKDKGYLAEKALDVS